MAEVQLIMRNRFLLALLGATTLGYSQTPSIRSSEGILNAASFGPVVAPGSLLSIFGTSLATGLVQASTVPLSTSLGGVTVEFVQGANSYPSPLLFVYQGDSTQNIPAQINSQLPWEIDPNGPAVTVTVTTGGTTSAPAAVPVGTLGPGIFASSGLAIAVNNADGTFAWATGAVPGLATHPVKSGDVIIIYATGLGPIDTPIPDGQAPVYLDGVLRTNTSPPTVMVGGVQAQLIYSVLSPQFVGVNQLAIVIPNGSPAGNSVPLQIQEGGVTSPASTTIAVTQ
jgi:uncharacterized protein (TIGR03437 family)